VVIDKLLPGVLFFCDVIKQSQYLYLKARTHALQTG
jgi:hypothetical protein